MKNGIRFFGLVAAVAIIGFAGCENGTSAGGNGGNGGNGNGNGNGGDDPEYELTYQLVGEEYTVTGGNYLGENVMLSNIHLTIPASHNGLPVTAIADEAAFHYEIYPGEGFNHSWINGLTLPNTIKTIGDKAFFGMSADEPLIIPESVETIGNYAFYRVGWGMDKNGELTLPNNVKIGSEAFSSSSFGDHNLYIINIGTGVQLADDSVLGDFKEKYAAGGAGRYTTEYPGQYWTKQ
jgi:hypothetical protein